MQILVIEDDDSLRHLLVRALTEEGYQVADARDGVQGMKRRHNRPSDLIITDIFMPQKDGLELIMELRRRPPHVPLIAISGGGQFGDLQILDAARKLGAIYTIEKPFHLPDLIALVNRLLRRQP